MGNNQMGNNRRIALGMSGGVDSSVAAVLLLQAGCDVVGVTGIFTDDASSRAASVDAAAVCEALGIKHVVKDCTVAFGEKVVRPFVASYADGWTPSPCVGCNASCKIPMLLSVADTEKCDAVATGHYARIRQQGTSGRYAVLAAVDSSKDQSYMLSRLSQTQLSRLVLPLGTMTKSEVRVSAKEYGLVVAEKPESQDICFIKGDHRDFLEEHGVSGVSGNIVDMAGNVLGIHQGLYRYTVGQRKGIGVAARAPYYVIGKDMGRNELVVGFKEAAVIDKVEVENLVGCAFDDFTDSFECEVKLRYRSKKAACIVEPLPSCTACAGSDADAGDAAASADHADHAAVAASVHLAKPQVPTAPGQYAVFYRGDTVIGSGLIRATGLST